MGPIALADSLRLAPLLTLLVAGGGNAPAKSFRSDSGSKLSGARGSGELRTGNSDGFVESTAATLVTGFGAILFADCGASGRTEGATAMFGLEFCMLPTRDRGAGCEAVP
jgi:hypothetical protein